VACSVSGAGEYIVRANLARLVCDAVTKGEDVDVHEILQRVLAEDFWKPSRNPANPDPGAGIILLTTEEGDHGRPIGRLWCAFTTSSMAIAYASSEIQKARPASYADPKPSNPVQKINRGLSSPASLYDAAVNFGLQSDV